MSVGGFFLLIVALVVVVVVGIALTGDVGWLSLRRGRRAPGADEPQPRHTRVDMEHDDRGEPLDRTP